MQKISLWVFLLFYMQTESLISKKGSTLIRVDFLERPKIQDTGNNILSTETTKISITIKKELSSTIVTLGKVFTIGSYLAFIMAIAMSPFKSSKSFWIFMNMAQLLSYIPILACDLPSNLRYFIIEYFGVSKASIPFDGLPEWIPNPFKYFLNFKTDPLNYV